jgi:hypothetical protein
MEAATNEPSTQPEQGFPRCLVGRKEDYVEAYTKPNSAITARIQIGHPSIEWKQTPIDFKPILDKVFSAPGRPERKIVSKHTQTLFLPKPNDFELDNLQLHRLRLQSTATKPETSV